MVRRVVRAQWGPACGVLRVKGGREVVTLVVEPRLRMTRGVLSSFAVLRWGRYFLQNKKKVPSFRRLSAHRWVVSGTDTVLVNRGRRNRHPMAGGPVRTSAAGEVPVPRHSDLPASVGNPNGALAPLPQGWSEVACPDREPNPPRTRLLQVPEQLPIQAPNKVHLEQERLLQLPPIPFAQSHFSHRFFQPSIKRDFKISCR